MIPFRAYRPEALTFLRSLKRNNRREWFEAHRDTYVRENRRTDPAPLVEELDVRFAALAPEFEGDPRRSLFRIYRDVRFSKDKTPYKSHAALWIYHRAPGRGVGKEIDGGAGFYVHSRTRRVARRGWVVDAAAAIPHEGACAAGDRPPRVGNARCPAPRSAAGLRRLTDDEPGVLLKRLAAWV